MSILNDIRREYPEFKGMNDRELSEVLRKKYYADMPEKEFRKQISASTVAPFPEAKYIPPSTAAITSVASRAPTPTANLTPQQQQAVAQREEERGFFGRIYDAITGQDIATPDVYSPQGLAARQKAIQEERKKLAAAAAEYDKLATRAAKEYQSPNAPDRALGFTERAQFAREQIKALESEYETITRTGMKVPEAQVVREVVGGVPREFLGGLASIPGSLLQLGGTALEAAGIPGGRDVAEAGAAMRKGARGAAEEVFGARGEALEYDPTAKLLADVAGGVGSIGTFLVPGSAAKLAGVGKGLTGAERAAEISRVARPYEYGIGTAQGLEQGIQDVEATQARTGEEVSPGKKLTAYLLNAGLGATEVGVASRIFESIPVAQRGAAIDAVTNVVRRGTAGKVDPTAIGQAVARTLSDIESRAVGRVAVRGAEEALQEGGVQLGTNVIAQQLYDPNRAAMEGVGYNALVGGIVGGGLRTVGEIASLPAQRRAQEAAAVAASPQGIAEFQRLAGEAVGQVMAANPGMTRNDAVNIVMGQAEKLRIQAIANILGTGGEPDVDTRLDVTGGGRAGVPTDLEPGGAPAGATELGAIDTGRVGEPVPSVPVPDVGTRAGVPTLAPVTAAQIKATVPTIEKAFEDNSIDFEDAYGIKKLNAEQKKQAARIVIQSPEVDPYDAIGSVLERGQRLRGEKVAPKKIAPVPVPAAPSIDQQAVEPIKQAIETATAPTPGAAVPSIAETAAKQAGIAPAATVTGPANAEELQAQLNANIAAINAKADEARAAIQAQAGQLPSEVQPTPTVAETATAEKAAPTINEYTISDAIDAEGPEDVRLVRRPDGSYIQRTLPDGNTQMIDVSSQVEAGLSDEEIIASRIGEDTTGKNVTAKAAAPEMDEATARELDMIDEELSQINLERAENAYEGEDPDTKADYEERIAALNARKAELEAAPAVAAPVEEAPPAIPLKLTKAAPTQWMGNQMGTQAATWNIKGYPGWTIWNNGTDWVATHEGRPNVKSYTKSMLVEKLGRVLAAEQAPPSTITPSAATEAALKQKEQVLKRMKKAPGKTARQKLFAVMQEDIENEVKEALAKNKSPEEIAEDLGVNPYDPEYEEIVGQAGLDTERMLRLQIAKYKGSPSTMTSVVVKELLQNSHDATRTAIEQGLIPQGKIAITTSPDGRTITIRDNGVGMSGELLAQAFLRLGSTGKGEGTGRNSGGFGMAKSLLLYGTDKADVITAKDGKIATLDTGGQQMFDAALAATTGDMSLQPRIKVRDFTEEDYAMFPQGHGTIVQLLMPDEDVDPYTGKPVKVDQLPDTYYDWHWRFDGLTHSPLFANTEVSYNGRNLPIGANFPLDKYKTFARVEMPFGTADIYITRDPVVVGKGTHILSDGVWQFTKNIKGLNNNELPYTIFMNFVPYENVKPDSSLYPFNEQRKNFSDSGEAAFNKLASLLRTTFGMGSFLDDIKSFGNIQYHDPLTGLPGAPIDLTPEIPQDVIDRLEKAATGDESQIKIGTDGRVEVNGSTVDVENIDELKKALPKAEDLIIDQSKIDSSRIMLHDAADVTIIDPNTGDERTLPIVDYMRERFGDRFDQYLFYVGSKFNELRNEVVKVMERKMPGEYKALLDEAIGNSLDPRYRGASTKVPFSGMFLNPLVPEASDPYERLEGIVTTMIHELSHYKVRGHDAAFPAEMQRIEAALNAEKRRQGFDFNKWVDDFVEHIVDSGYGDIIDAGQYLFATEKDREDGTYGYDPEYKNARVSYRGGRFADHSAEQVPERGAAGEGAAEDNGAAGAGGAGAEQLLGPSYEGRGRAGGRGKQGAGAEGGAEPITNEAVDKAVSVKLTKAQMRRLEEAAGIRRKELNNMQKRIVQSRNTEETLSLIGRLTKAARKPGEDVGIIASLTRSLPPAAYRVLLGFQQIETVFALARKAKIKALEQVDDLMRNGYIPYVNRIVMAARDIDEMWGAFAANNPEGNMALDDVIMISNMMNVDPSQARTAADYMLIDDDLRSLQWKLLQSKDPEEKSALKNQIGRRRADIQRVYFGGEEETDTGKKIEVAGWNDVPPEGRKIYTAARDFYRNNFNEHYRLIMQRIDDAKFDEDDAKRVKSSIEKMFAKARERVIYFPVKRFGEYWVSVGNDFYMRESLAEQEALIDRLKAEGETRDITPGEGRENLRKLVANKDASGALKDILDLLDTGNTVDSKGNPKITDMDDLRDLVFQMYLAALPEADMRRRFIHREFKTGFSTDALRTFASTAVASANQLGRLAYNYRFQAAIEAAKKETEGKRMKPWLDTLTNEVKSHVDGVMSPQQNDLLDAMIAFAGKLTFFNLLSSPSSAFMNLTQLHIVGLPVLSAEFGEVKTAAMASRYTASFLLGQEVPNPFRNEEGNLELQAPDFRFENSGYMRRLKESDPKRYKQTLDAWNYAKEHDVIESTFSAGADLYTRSNVPTGDFTFRQAVRRGEVLTAAQRATANTINAMGFMFHNSEKIGRSIMYMSSFDLAYERAINQGKTPEEAGVEARDLAAKLTNKGMFDFSNWNKSRFAKSRLGRLPLQMQSYRQSMNMLLARNFVRMLPFMNKEGKLAAARVFFGVAGVTALYGGIRVTHISAMVLAAYAILKYVESLADDDDEEKEVDQGYLESGTIERNILKYADEHGDELAMKNVEYYMRSEWINQTFGKGSSLQSALNLSDETAAKLATVADMGLPALGGVDISNSVALNDFWTPVEAKGNTPEVRALETLARYGLGPTANSLAQYVKAGQAWQEGNINVAFETMLPAIIRNRVKAERLESEGLRIGKNEDIVLKDPTYYTSAKSALISLGFRDAETSRNLQLDIAAGKIEDEVQAEQTKLLDRRYRAILDFEANPSKENEREWNRAERNIDIYNLIYPSNAISTETKEKSLKAKRREAADKAYGLGYDTDIPVRLPLVEQRAAQMAEEQ